jgi:hypothetical protein
LISRNAHLVHQNWYRIRSISFSMDVLCHSRPMCLHCVGHWPREKKKGGGWCSSLSAKRGNCAKMTSGNYRNKQVRDLRVKSRGHEILWRHRDFPSQILYDESSKRNEHQTVFTLPLDRGLLPLVWLNHQDFLNVLNQVKRGHN